MLLVPSFLRLLSFVGVSVVALVAAPTTGSRSQLEPFLRVHVDRIEYIEDELPQELPARALGSILEVIAKLRYVKTPYLVFQGLSTDCADSVPITIYLGCSSNPRMPPVFARPDGPAVQHIQWQENNQWRHAILILWNQLQKAVGSNLSSRLLFSMGSCLFGDVPSAIYYCPLQEINPTLDEHALSLRLQREITAHHLKLQWIDQFSVLRLAKRDQTILRRWRSRWSEELARLEQTAAQLGLCSDIFSVRER